MYSIDDLIPYLEDLKISAFQKVDLIKDEVHEVTLGPNSSPTKPTDNEHYHSTPRDSVISTQESQQKSSDTTDEIIPIRQTVKEYELERLQRVREDVENHTKKFNSFAEQQNVYRRQEWLLQQQKFVQNMQHQENQIMQALKEYEDNKSNDHEKLVLYFKEVEEKRKKGVAVLEAKKKEKELMKQCLDNQGIFHAVYREIMVIIQNCQNEKLKAGLALSWRECKKLNDLMSATILKCKSNISVEEYKKTDEIVQKVTQIKNEVETFLKNEHLRKQQEIEERNKQKVMKETTVESSNSENTVIAVPIMNVSSDKVKEPTVTSFIDKYINKSNFKSYSELMEFNEKYTDSFKDLMEDDRLKQFRFDCKKAVNLTVNAISAVNPQHLKDKYVKLSNLLRGQNVVIGDFKINAARHPKGIQFCTDLLAKKFVLQGDLMVSSNAEAAFAFATIILSLWNESPDFGKILLCSFFKECPYLVPFYCPKSVDQSDDEFYKSCGYQYVDGQIEKQDKFLKRMTGIMRLYFSILISSPKQGQNENPYNIKVAWTWFVSVLKLENRIDITATMLHTFLETVGFEMQNTYKMQFFKLLRFFVERYVPNLKKMDSGGPVTRLESLIQEFKENKNQFKPPLGILPKNFW